MENTKNSAKKSISYSRTKSNAEKVTLIMIRHGETTANVRRINQGQIGGTLTKKGISQSKRAGLELRNKKIDEFYISDLKRTRDTAEKIIEYHKDAKIIYAKDLREQKLGILENSRQGKEDALLKGLKEIDFRPKNGESLKDMCNRVNRYRERIVNEKLEESRRTHKDITVVIITHGGPIVCLLMGITGKTEKNRKGLKKFLPKNTAISTINIYQKDFKILKINSTRHLK